jgi:hypothetical protein
MREKPPLSRQKRISGPLRGGKPLLTDKNCGNGATPATALNVLKKTNNGRKTMKGKMYRTAVAVKDFGERLGLGFVAGIGKIMREIAMRITWIG